VKVVVLTTEELDSWMAGLPVKHRIAILARLDHVSIGHFGDHKRFEGLIELHWRNGTRVYLTHWGREVMVVLIGGNKNGQSRDIKKAKKIRGEILAGLRTFRK
jgi:putative addiction module killer protein